MILVFHVQKWSYFLAGRARNFALQCTFRHCHSQSHYGQNNYYAAPYLKPGYAYVAMALKMWMSERETYNRDRRFKCCGLGPTFTAKCCHYKQVVLVVLVLLVVVVVVVVVVWWWWWGW